MKTAKFQTEVPSGTFDQFVSAVRVDSFSTKPSESRKFGLRRANVVKVENRAQRSNERIAGLSGFDYELFSRA